LPGLAANSSFKGIAKRGRKMESEVSEASRGLFVQIPLVVLHDPDVSHAAKLAYARLLLYAGRDGLCNPAQETLAAEVCLSSRQVRTVLSELKARGWITWKRTRTSCWYEITGPVPDRKKTADLNMPDRKKTAGEIGRFPPVRSEENFLQKDLRKEQRKESVKKRTPAYASGKPPMRSQFPVSEDLPFEWTDMDVFNLQEQIGAFMDGEQPPANLTIWILDLAREYGLSANDVHGGLQAAWRRNGAPGRKNAPRDWNFFYEVLRNAFIPGYEARVCGP
jgi:hypothetical protein